MNYWMGLTLIFFAGILTQQSGFVVNFVAIILAYLGGVIQFWSVKL